MREFGLDCHAGHSIYVGCYLTRHKVVCYIGVEGICRCSKYKTLPSAIEASHRFRTSASNFSLAKSSDILVPTVLENRPPSKSSPASSSQTKVACSLKEETSRDDLVRFRAALGYVPEEAHIYTYLSGLEYLQLIGRLREMSESLIEHKANICSGYYPSSPGDIPRSPPLQGHEGSASLLPRRLMHDPRLLIFDEPLSGLDVVSARLFKDLLQELAAQGKAILYISHVLEVVEQVCDRVIVIGEGRILADAPPSELTKLMKLPSLQDVFAQLVQQEDTKALAPQNGRSHEGARCLAASASSRKPKLRSSHC